MIVEILDSIGTDKLDLTHHHRTLLVANCCR